MQTRDWGAGIDCVLITARKPGSLRPVKAWVVHELGGPDSMRFEDVDAGEPEDGLVRINIKAAGINFSDALMVAGQYQSKPPLPFVPGSEIAGEVASAPEGSGFRAGEHVMALVDNTTLTRGAYAQ